MKKDQYLNIGSLSVAENLYNFVNNELLPGTKISTSKFWDGFSKTAHSLTKRNNQLIEIREEIQGRKERQESR